jgi:hypothetical protein
VSWVAKDPLGAALGRVTRLAAALAAGALVAPDPVGAALAGAAVAVVVAAPLARVTWLALSWRREGDTRFAALAAALLAVVATGALAGMLT